MGLYLQIARKLFSKGYTKHEIEVAYNFIEAHIKFRNNDSYGIFEEKIDDMVTQFETTEEILSNFFDKEKKMLRMKEAEERAEKKAERERQAKERERQAKERSVLLLLKQGVSSDMIAKALDVPVENILQIQEKYKDNNPIDEILNH